MEVIGNDSEGFSIESSEGQLRVRAWGFWSAELSLQFSKEVLRALNLNQRGAPLTFDATALKPMRVEGQDALQEILVQACRLGRSVKIVIESPLMKLQLLRIVRDAGKGLPISIVESPGQGG